MKNLMIMAVCQALAISMVSSAEETDVGKLVRIKKRCNMYMYAVCNM